MSEGLNPEQEWGVRPGRIMAADGPNQSSVAQQVERLTVGLQHLDEVTKALDERIGAVLLPESDAKSDGGPVAMVMQSPLSEQLENLGDRLDRRISHIHGMLGRVNL
jgi:hypothetical protein